MNTEIETVGSRIKNASENCGGMRSLAEKSGIPYTTLHGYGSGKSEPRASDLVSIATATGVNLEWLLTGKGEMTPKSGGDGRENTDKSMGDSGGDGGGRPDLPRRDSPSGAMALQLAGMLYRLIKETNIYRETTPERFDKLVEAMYGMEMEDIEAAVKEGREPSPPSIGRYRALIKAIM